MFHCIVQWSLMKTDSEDYLEADTVHYSQASQIKF